MCIKTFSAQCSIYTLWAHIAFKQYGVTLYVNPSSSSFLSSHCMKFHRPHLMILDPQCTHCYFLPTAFSSFLRSLAEILWQNTLISLSTSLYHSPQLHPLKSPFLHPCIRSADRELRVLCCPLCHVILPSSHNQASAALSCGLCHSCVRFGCIKSTLWLCLITDSEDKVRGRLLAEWRYHTVRVKTEYHTTALASAFHTLFIRLFLF